MSDEEPTFTYYDELKPGFTMISARFVVVDIPTPTPFLMFQLNGKETELNVLFGPIREDFVPNLNRIIEIAKEHDAPAPRIATLAGYVPSNFNMEYYGEEQFNEWESDLLKQFNESEVCIHHQPDIDGGPCGAQCVFGKSN